MRNRPTVYTAEIAEKILQELRGGRAVRDICGDDGMPAYSTLLRWMVADPAGFAAQYKQVRQHGGRTVYNEVIAECILEELMTGRTLRAICREAGIVPESTVRQWVADDREGFAARYSRARELGFHSFADQIVEIADDDGDDWVQRQKADGSTEWVPDPTNVKRARLRCEVRRWVLAKGLPKVYGDRLDLTASHDVGGELAELMRAVDGRTRGLPRNDAVQNYVLVKKDSIK